MRRVLALVTVSLALSGVAFAQKANDLDKKELAMLQNLEKSQKAAKAKYDKNPKDAAAKKAYVATTMKLADAQLVSPALTPKVKYPSALRNYRIVVKLDPKNKDAREKIDTIESIYMSMGRPIPPN